MPPSPGIRSPPPDRMKQNILKDSSAGWSNTISPLRISKRDTNSNTGSDSGTEGSLKLPNGNVLARRQSSSYKHMFHNNLVSKSPFKSQQIPVSQRASNIPQLPSRLLGSPRGLRKISGEKRPRPESLVQQAEQENLQRTRELGFKRKQSKGFQNLVVKEPVSKSPFRRVVSPSSPPASTPIQITLPRDLKSIDDDVTSTEDTDSLSSKGKGTDYLAPEVPPPPPPKPLPSLSRPLTPQHPQHSPIRVSPLPSALQASPARPSLVSKRLKGPRTRSLSGSPSDTPTRERRKTVTFDERCDVVEFDRESHEDVFIDTDDEDVYGRPEPTQEDNFQEDTSTDSFTTQDETPMPTQTARMPSPKMSYEANDSISGLVDSMLQDAAYGSEPSTPPSNQPSFSLANDVDMMNGGGDGGVPHGRMHHHSDRARGDGPHLTPYKTRQEQDAVELPLPKEGDDDEPSFSSISLSTPPKQTGVPSSVERDEVGIPLGRTHHSERHVRRQEIENEMDEVLSMLPPSPSPLKKSARDKESESEPHIIVPKFDLGLDLPRQTNYDGALDFFGMPEEKNQNRNEDMDEFERSILSNTSVASFHDLPSQSDHDEGPVETAIVKTSREQFRISSMHDKKTPPINYESQPNVSVAHSDFSLGQIHSMEADIIGELPPFPLEPTKDDIQLSDLPFEMGASTLPPTASSSNKLDTMFRRSSSALVASGSQGSIGSNGRSRSPRISREDVMRRLEKKRSQDSPLATSHEPVEPQLHAPLPLTPSGRVPLEERLKRALSPPSVPSPTPIRPSSIGPLDPIERPIAPTRSHTYDGTSRASMDFNQADVEMEMSALDRLVEDMNSSRARGSNDQDDSILSERAPAQRQDTFQEDDPNLSLPATDVAADTDEDQGVDEESKMDVILPHARTAKHASTAPILSLPSTFDPRINIGSRVSSVGSIAPPPPPPKEPGNAIKEREALIREKKREARMREEGTYIPPRRDSAGRLIDSPGHAPRRSSGRPSARRSLSTGDALDLQSEQAGPQRRISDLKKQLGGVLGVPLQSVSNPLEDSIERELKKLENAENKTYHLREREVIYASSAIHGTVSHMEGVGDLDSGKAWRPVRRPSDMNEYSRQIKEYRANTKGSKTHGRVFVKVLGIKNLAVPMPSRNIQFTCTLNNGIHFVTTPESTLARESRIEQEFELIEHGKLEFTLTIKIRRDPYIAAQLKALSAPPPPPPIQRVQTAPPPPPPQTKGGGMRSFFGGSSKKPKPRLAPQPTPPPPPPHVIPPLEENLARYMKPDGTLARSFVSFKEIADRCDTKLFETSYPLIGQRLESRGGSLAPRQVGEIVLQLFRLPPLPGVPPDELPQSLEDCLRGLRHTNWHKQTYYEGTLTQNGGDCSTWRRRRFRVIGSNLVAFNDITRRAITTIDIKKAVAIEDDQEDAVADCRSPASFGTSRSRRDLDDADALYGVERSFRLVFSNDQEISFFADTDEEKAKWLEVLRALVGHIPPNPLWAELIWQRQAELAKGSAS